METEEFQHKINNDIDCLINEEFLKLCDIHNLMLLLVEKGSIQLQIGTENCILIAPCIYARKDTEKCTVTDSDKFEGKAVIFSASFIDKKISCDIVNDGKYKYISDEMNWPPLNMFIDRDESFKGIITLNNEDAENIKEIIKKIRNSLSLRPQARWDFKSRLYLKILLETTHQKYIRYQEENDKKYDLKNPNIWVRMIEDEIKRNFRNKISLTTLSEKVHINRTTVAKRFREITGYTVSSYITKQRTEAAKEILTSTCHSVEEIAAMCGFANVSHFIKQFREVSGTTPGDYRKAKIEKN